MTSPEAMCPNLPAYECFLGQYSPFGLFVLEHYLRCRDRVWSQQAATVDQWGCIGFPERPDEVNYFWEQLHERCSSVWSLLAPEERVRFVGLGVSFRVLVEQARTLNKRLVGVLREDKLAFDLEQANSHLNNFATLFDPGSPVQSPVTTTEPRRDFGTMTDPVMIRSVSESSSDSSNKKTAKKRGPKRCKKRYIAGEKKLKRVRTAYMMFMASEGVRIRKELPYEMSEQGALGKYMGQLWKSMSIEEKEPYNEMARQDKERYIREKARSPASTSHTVTSGLLEQSEVPQVSIPGPLVNDSNSTPKNEASPFFYSQI